MSFQTIKNYYHLLQAVFAVYLHGFPGQKIKVIGVTGTDGKTTTVHLIYEILKKAGKKVSMISSVYAMIGGKEYDTGFHVTTPSSWFVQGKLKEALEKGDEFFVLEVTSHSLDQYRVWGIPFEAGVLTNITNEHLDYHKSYKEYAAVKLRLLKSAKTAVYNIEDISVQKILNFKNQILNKNQNKKILAYGLKNGDINLKNFSFQTNLPGDYNQLNCLAAATVTKQLGISDQLIKTAISKFTGVSGRFEHVKTGKDFDVIIDFAHTPNALENVLKEIRSKTKGKPIHVFGCAGLRDFKKRPQMGEISAKYANVIIITEEDYRTEQFEDIADQIQKGIRNSNFEIQILNQNSNEKSILNKDKKAKKLFIIKNRQEAVNKAIELAGKGDVVVLTGKGHEKSLCRGKTEYSWSEHEAVKSALKK